MSNPVAKTENRKKSFGNFDFLLFIVVMALCAFGLVMVFSASYYTAQIKQNDGMYFLKRQLAFFGLGLAAMLGLSFFPYKWLKPLAPFVYIVALGGLIATLIWGNTVNEAKRWITVGSFTFQPSEFSKLGIVLMLAYLICDTDRGKIIGKRIGKWFDITSPWKGVLPCIIILGIYAVPVLLQPNFSLVVILSMTTYVMLFLGGSNRFHRLILLILGAAVLFVFIRMEDYRWARITAFINPDADPTGAGYQIRQSRIAIANGGLFGQGLNASRQKLLFLPEMENDYIFAIIAEEWGLAGCLVVIAAYCFFVLRGISIAQRSTDRFAQLTAGGVTFFIGIQAFLNIGVVIGALPTTGQTLPFISYGGTALVSVMASVGVLLNISRFTEVRTLNAKRLFKKEE